MGWIPGGGLGGPRKMVERGPNSRGRHCRSTLPFYIVILSSAAIDYHFLSDLHSNLGVIAVIF